MEKGLGPEGFKLWEEHRAIFGMEKGLGSEGFKPWEEHRARICPGFILRTGWILSALGLDLLWRCWRCSPGEGRAPGLKGLQESLGGAGDTNRTQGMASGCAEVGRGDREVTQR